MDLSVTKIKETCLYVQNLQDTREFYHDKIGLPVIGEVEGQHVFFKAGNSVLLCFVPESSKVKTALPPHYGYGNLHFAFEVPLADFESWKQKISSAGIPIVQEVEWKKNVLSFYFHDPDGHVAEIVTPGLWD